MFWPCETRTSTCRSFATISSGLYRFLAIAVLLDVKDIPQVGPLQWGWITVALLLLGLVLPTGEAVSQQAGPTLHRYLVRAALTAEGLKNLQKQPPTALKAGVAKFAESVGGKLEFWYFDYGGGPPHSLI